MANNQYDLIVIGGGPAGYSAAIRAAQLGANAAVIEKEKFGGTCMHAGCIPTKYLCETLHLIRRIKKSASYGIFSDIKIANFAEIQKQKEKTIYMLNAGLIKLIQSYPIEMINGSAVFKDKNTLEVTENDGNALELSSKRIIIAAGSSPRSLPGLEIDHEKILDSTDILNAKKMPKSLLIVGGGAIGVEFATIAAGFGSSVLLVEKEGQLLPGEDKELAEEVKKSLQRQGIKVQVGQGSINGYMQKYESILVAVGRKPNVSSLNLEKANIKYSEKGIDVNTHFETSQNGIYAAGDVTGNGFYAYTAQAEGVLAAENAMGKKSTSDCPPVPRVVFSHPTIASVGAGEHFRASNTVTTGYFPFAANGKAAVLGERSGWVKIVANKETGRILAGQIIGLDAENMISIIAIAIKHKLTVNDLSREMFFHPSVAETIHGACEDVLKKCIDLPRK
jgi:dihydrolipoamide dehydrogenase